MIRIGNLELGGFPLLLAPMEDVSDPPFRMVCKQKGADLMYTEFISSEGLIRHAAKSKKKLDIFEYERPIGIQIFGSEKDSMRQAAVMAAEANPDLIDINYGCPVKNVACKGAGAALLQDVPKMVSITKSIVDAVQIPVTVKTRLGWDDKSKNIIDVAERLQDIGIQAITIHGRTRSQMYKGAADWNLIAEVKNNQRMKIPVFGNGDIDTPQKAMDYRNRFGVDGIMIGRAAIGNPWIFKNIKHFFSTGSLLPDISLAERAEVCRQHLDFSIRWKGEKLGILEMRRHYANYFKGVPHVKELRMKLVTEYAYQAIIQLLDEAAGLPVIA
ncbi:MAG: tRNA dihydrouridine synthase DusB [Bacteroidia bacterium]|nr:tRNA dihydrouridine synthase DusB [Bacteroidia bacterium]